MTTIERKGQEFPSSYRLRKRGEFHLVRRSGKVKHTSHFIVVIMEKKNGPTRLGLTVSRKVGGAVQRNRVKRLLREFFRQNYHCIRNSVDISVIGKRGAADISLDTITEQLYPVVTGLCRDHHVN